LRNLFKGRIAGVLAGLLLSGAAIGQGFGTNDLHDFGGTFTYLDGTSGNDSELPFGGMVMDAAGTLYGTALGGEYLANMDGGMLWSLTKAGVYRDLHDFAGPMTFADGSTGTDGTLPIGKLVRDSAGTLWGVSTYGSEYNHGNIWKLTSDGTYTIVHHFGGMYTMPDGSIVPDGSYPQAGIQFDANGNMFGTTSSGGQFGPGTLWELTAAGQYKILHHFGFQVTNANGSTGPDGVGPYGSIAIDGSGSIFGNCSSGGPNVNSSGQFAGMVWEFKASGDYVDLHDFNFTDDGYLPQCGVVLDAVGNLYGATFNGFVGGAVWKIDTTGAYSILCIFDARGNGASGDLVFDAAGNLYGATETVGSIWRIPAGGALTYLATGIPSIVGGILLDSSGNMYSAIALGGAHSAGYVAEFTVFGQLSFVSSRVVGGNPGTGAISIGLPAPAGGLVVTLSSNTAVAAVPASVTIPAGAYSANFPITTTALSNQVTASIKAKAMGITESANFVVVPALASVSANPRTIVSGLPSTGTVTLNGAVTTDTVVTLASNLDAVTVPAFVTVPAGSTSATFDIATSAVATNEMATITATNDGTKVTTTMSLAATTLRALSTMPSTVGGAAQSTGTVTLSGPAPTGGILVALSSSSTTATVPASVTVPAGASTGNFTISTIIVATDTTVTFTAASAGVSKTATLLIKAPAVSSLVIAPAPVIGGSSTTGTVTLTGITSKSGLKVTLSSASTTATVPPYVTVPAGQSTATFTIRTTTVAANTPVTITALTGSISKTFSLTVESLTVTSLTLSPSTVTGGTSSTGTVTVSAPAPAGGLSVSLSSSKGAATLPATVVIPAGATSATFTVSTTHLSSSLTAAIKATVGKSSQSANLTITP